MSLRNNVRALPAMLKVSFLDSLAYRAELFVWILATSMPLIMLALFSAVARDAPIGRFGQSDFVAYFLATFIVRQLTSCWASWQINFEVRDGTLGQRLVRPVHPLWHYAAEQLAYVPLRVLVSLVAAAILLAAVGTHKLAHDPVVWAIWALSLLGAWLITLFVQLAIGCLALLLESSLKIQDIYLAAFQVMSGYIIPIELFPRGVRAVADFLPFRYQIGFPVELMTGAYARSEALAMLGRQWAFVLVTLALVVVVWRRGVGRFAAYGG
jgi:ABC-2 type transport system permease protein